MQTDQRRLVVSAVLVGLTASSGQVVLAAKKPPDSQVVVRGNSRFALDLYAKLKAQQGNLFFSPYSISTALGMTYAGARGDTAAQMAKVLHFELPQERLHPGFAALINDLNAAGKKGDYQLSIANALWGQKSCGFLKEFLDLTRSRYGAGLNEVDFKKATETARKTINAWVEKQTRDKIKNLIKPGVLNALTKLVLTNAIYFKGNWTLKFEEQQTREEPFTLANGSKLDVAMMHQTAEFRYTQGDDFQALELPYAGERLSMMVLLPVKFDGLAAFEKRLTTENLARWLSTLRHQEVVVAIPKFKMTWEFRLDRVLKSMGMAGAFSQGADFSGMTGRKDLFISAVLHKAFVDVNEEGTEAAAATGVLMELKAAIPVRPPPVFRADRPFVFLIRDVRSGSILFIGRVADPKGK